MERVSLRVYVCVKKAIRYRDASAIILTMQELEFGLLPAEISRMRVQLTREQLPAAQVAHVHPTARGPQRHHWPAEGEPPNPIVQVEAH